MMINVHPDLWAQGCSICRAALESSPDGKTIAASLKNGIMLMLILPYGLIGTFGFIIYREYRKKLKQRNQDPQSHYAEPGR